MKPPRTDDHADRRKSADEAKKALLEKFKAAQGTGKTKSTDKANQK